MILLKLIRHVTGSKKKFADSYLYYRFAIDDTDSAVLSNTNAGNGDSSYLGMHLIIENPVA